MCVCSIIPHVKGKIKGPAMEKRCRKYAKRLKKVEKNVVKCYREEVGGENPPTFLQKVLKLHKKGGKVDMLTKTGADGGGIKK